MITYLVFIALLNTAVGFLLAVYFLPPAALAGIRIRIPLPKIPNLARRSPNEKEVEQTTGSVEPEEADPPEPTTIADLDDTSSQTSEPSLSEPVPNDDPPDVAASTDDRSEDSPAVTDEDETIDQIPPDWLDTLDEYGIQAASLVEASAQVLRLEVSTYRDQLVRIDSNARQKVDSIDATTVQLHLDELREINETWLAKQTESADHLASRAEGLGDRGGLASRLLEILQNQRSHIETTIGNMAEFDIEGDPNGCTRRLLVDIRKLLDLAHILRDRMMEMLLEIKKTEDRLSDIDRSMSFDGLTKLHNRAGMEKVLHGQFFFEQSRNRQLSCALVDVDKFAVLMDRHGPIVCDHILVALGQLLNSLLRQDRGFDLTARFDGQRFFALMGDTGPRGAMSAVERMRQTIETTTFDYDGQPIELTVRAGVAELRPDETVDSFFERMELAIDAAKTAGRNCARLDEGDGPKKVDAPDYDIAGRIIPLV